MLRARKKLIVERGVLAALIKRANIQIYREALCLQMFFKILEKENAIQISSNCNLVSEKSVILSMTPGAFDFEN